MHKRKHRKSLRDDDWDQSAQPATGSSYGIQSTDNSEASAPDPCLHVQAHEADVIRGPPALSARSLEYDPSMITSGHISRPALIRWGPERPYDTDTVDPHGWSKPPLWVDRYDVRLLLDHLPDFQSETTQHRPLSPSGWSDLPSDSEDTFFFSPDELEDYRREKRRRLIDHGREERLRALAATEGPTEDPDPWGGSDEEPDESQRELIRRTASHIVSSPNPGQLEMRILANHGTDKRFAFLRGRWSRVWRTEKERAKQCRAEETKRIQSPTSLVSLGGLASYGDSDTDSEEQGDKMKEEPPVATNAPPTQDSHSNEDDIKEARRARAREWSARRRAEHAPRSEDA